MAAKQSFVGGNNMFAMLKGTFKNLSGRMLATNQLNYDVNLGVGNYIVPVGSKRLALNAGGLGLLPLQSASALEAQVNTVRGQVLVVMTQNKASHTAAHGTQAYDAYVDGAKVLLHCCSFKSVGCCATNCILTAARVAVITAVGRWA